MRTPSGRAGRRQLYVREGVDLQALAARVRYVGSVEHKTYPSPAGQPRPRADASKCDPQLHGSFAELTTWLREGMVAGNVGAPWEGDFPRYVWYSKNGVWYEGRLVNREQGTYKGYAVTRSELPGGL